MDDYQNKRDTKTGQALCARMEQPPADLAGSKEKWGQNVRMEPGYTRQCSMESFTKSRTILLVFEWNIARIELNSENVPFVPEPFVHNEEAATTDFVLHVKEVQFVGMRKELLKAFIAVVIEETVRALIPPLIPLVWLLILWGLTWEILSQKRIRDRFEGLYGGFGKGGRVLSFGLVGLLGAGISIGYWAGIHKAISAIRKISKELEAESAPNKSASSKDVVNPSIAAPLPITTRETPKDSTPPKKEVLPPKPLRKKQEELKKPSSEKTNTNIPPENVDPYVGISDAQLINYAEGEALRLRNTMPLCEQSWREALEKARAEGPNTDPSPYFRTLKFRLYLEIEPYKDDLQKIHGSLIYRLGPAARDARGDENLRRLLSKENLNDLDCMQYEIVAQYFYNLSTRLKTMQRPAP